LGGTFSICGPSSGRKDVINEFPLKKREREGGVCADVAVQSFPPAPAPGKLLAAFFALFKINFRHPDKEIMIFLYLLTLSLFRG